MKRALGREDWFWIVGALLAVLLFVAVEAKALAADMHDGIHANDCSGPAQAVTYVAQPGDSADATSFTASRSFSGMGNLKLNVCAGELRILPAKQPGQLRIHISVPAREANAGSLREAIRALEVSPERAEIAVRTPKSAHATVTIEVPASSNLHSEINLGSGRLQLASLALAGDRKLNLGAGHMELDCDGDRSYAEMELNVGMGSIHDRRRPGHSSYGALRADIREAAWVASRPMSAPAASRSGKRTEAQPASGDPA